MKIFDLKIICPVLFVLVITSCAETDPMEFQVEKPLSIVQQEELNSLETLKNYVQVANFKLGAGASISSYNSKGSMFGLTNSNFQELTAGYGMKHGAVVQSDGSLSVEAVETFIENTQNEGLTVYGHTLAWHANQNAEFLNSTIAPVVIPSTEGPAWDPITIIDFETEDPTGYQSNGPNAVLSFTADGEGANNEGRALIVNNNEVRPNEWESQLFVTFDKVTEVGQKYQLEMDLRADSEVAINTQAQTAPGSYKFYNFFGTLNATTEWKSISVEITIDENTSGCNTIAFNLGTTATNYYFDNIVVSWFNESGGELIVEKTPEEKRDTLSFHLDKWISGIMEVSKSKCTRVGRCKRTYG